MDGEENINNEGQENGSNNAQGSRGNTSNVTNGTPKVHANISNKPNELNVDTSNVNANTLFFIVTKCHVNGAVEVTAR